MYTYKYVCRLNKIVKKKKKLMNEILIVRIAR